MPPSFAARLTPRHKVWLDLGSSFLMGPNYLRFLQAVHETGTIREAGKAVGWSYRTCLNRVRRMEKALGRPVLLTTRGGSRHGGARLAPEVRWLLAVFARYREEMHRLSHRAFARALRSR
ncbi:MAG TPA: LysR family transcriptional regulator [Gemmatimonadales bacterium]|jgi:molybdate transport system regulatory protein|nr:LysR family transcriptional regulator [Gemmatimonadales bacterium]